MSFALQVKEEVISHDFDSMQSQAFLSGFIKYNGEFSWSSGKEKLKLTSISNRIARAIFKLCKQHFNGVINIGISQAQHEKTHRTYYVILEGNVSEFLKQINVFDQSDIKLVEFTFTSTNIAPKEITNLKRAYIAGMFVAIGSVNSPETTNYHLELQFKDDASAKYWVKLLKEFNFDFKYLKRSEKNHIAYIKKSLLVSDFLKLIDAYQGVMLFENERISREFTNNVNRITNIDVYNGKKTLTVGLRQISEISKIQANIATNKLSVKAQALADLRIANPDSSYTELTEMMNELGFVITKSGVSNLFRMIHKLSEEFN